MLNCRHCRNTFPTIKGFVLHLKVKHNYSALSNCICTQEHCHRNFQSMSSFIQHLRRKHSQLQHNASATNLRNVQQQELPLNCEVSQLNLDKAPDVHEDRTSPNFNPPDNISEELPSIVQREAAAFLAKLYSKPSVPRSLVQDIVGLTNEFLGSRFIGVIKHRIRDQVELGQCSEAVGNNISSHLDAIQTPFAGLETEYQRKRFFEKTGNYIPHTTHVIGQRMMSGSTRDGHTIVEPVSVEVQFFPLRKILARILGINSTLDQAVEYVESARNCENGIYTDFLSGNLWKEKRSLFAQESVVLPLFIYFDDFETGNALGSHAGVHKLGAVYCRLQCFPPEYLSQVTSILPCLLFHSSDRVEFGNEAVFRILINELHFLENEGIDVATSQGSQKVHFILGLVLGDNLGIHSLLGFTESFSANHPCRFCKIHKSQMVSDTTEHENLLRNEMNYRNDVALDNLSLTGIKEECVWNGLKCFHAIENFACDIMHDMLEGVCVFDLSRILRAIVLEKKIISLEYLNSRIQHFDFGALESDSKPGTITSDALRTGNLRTSASEMLCLVRNLGLMIGDLVPENDEHWKLYLCLRDIMDILLSPSIQSECLVLLQCLITEHHDLYIDLFHEALKPKHHFMLHYVRIIRNSGSPVHTWSMRFESMHFELKKMSNVIFSRRNITKTLAIKLQFQLCERLMSNRSICERLSVGPGNMSPNFNWHTLMEDVDRVPSALHNNVYVAKWIKHNGVLYGPEFVVVTGVDENGPKFGEIILIAVSSERDVWFLCSNFETKIFDLHMHAYEVSHAEDNCKILLSINDLIEYAPLNVRFSANGNMYITMKHSM